MAEGLGFGRRRLIKTIVETNWNTPVEKLRFSFNDLLYVVQELLTEEGKQYFEKRTTLMGHNVFRFFAEHLLYRNIANYDSMVLITSEKGCITGDALLEMPRDLKKYPKGVPLKELVGKGEQWVYCFNNETLKLELKKCDGVEFVKKDDVWEIELTNGMKIQATKDHPFLLMNNQYKQLQNLHWNCYKRKNKTFECGRYMKNKKLYYTDRLRIFSRPYILDLNDNRIKVDFSKINRKNKDTSLKHSDIEHRFILKQLGYNIDEKIIHHLNGKTYDNNINNLCILDNQSKHYKIHNMQKYHFKINNKFGINTGYSTKQKIKLIRGTEKYKKNCKNKRIEWYKLNKNYVSKISLLREKNNVHSSSLYFGGIIKSITYIGKRDVYDVVNVRDNHNFIVNGFVVSNTGKSSAAIMLARYWCKLLGIQFSPERHIAYNNADITRKVELLRKFEPIIADESIRFASSEDWAKKENKELKKKLAQVRTKHLLYVLCFPLKVQKVDKVYLESNVNYWVDLFGRGKGAIYVKDKNPSLDSWRIKDFGKVGSYNEFTPLTKVEKILKKHPNFWTTIKFPKPPEWLYKRYLKVREKNVYDDENVMASVTKEDIQNALLVLALRDIMMRDEVLTMNRIILHIKNQYDIPVNKSMVEAAIEDARQLIVKVQEQSGKINYAK